MSEKCRKCEYLKIKTMRSFEEHKSLQKTGLYEMTRWICTKKNVEIVYQKRKIMEC